MPELQTCPKCLSEVSAAASKCAHCGSRLGSAAWRTNRIRNAVVLVIVALIVANVLMQSDSTPATVVRLLAGLVLIVNLVVLAWELVRPAFRKGIR